VSLCVCCCLCLCLYMCMCVSVSVWDCECICLCVCVCVCCDFVYASASLISTDFSLLFINTTHIMSLGKTFSPSSPACRASLTRRSPSSLWMFSTTSRTCSACGSSFSSSGDALRSRYAPFLCALSALCGVVVYLSGRQRCLLCSSIVLNYVCLCIHPTIH
jgi:hypothetical protein